MRVEMYVGDHDNTWGEDWIEIPNDAPESQIIAVTERMYGEWLEDHGQTVAFFGIYSIPSPEEE